MRRLSLILIAVAIAGTAACGDTATTSQSATSGAATPAPATPTASAAPAAGVPSQAAAYNGAYTGTWTNKTLGSTGTAASTVTIDMATGKASTTLTLTGNVFGAAAPAPETFNGTVTATGATFTGTSPTFGPYTISITPGGVFSMRCSAVPGGRIATYQADGTVSPTVFDFTYNVTFVGGTTPPANGVVHMARAAS